MKTDVKLAPVSLIAVQITVSFRDMEYAFLRLVFCYDETLGSGRVPILYVILEIIGAGGERCPQPVKMSARTFDATVEKYLK